TLLADESQRAARGERIIALSRLLPRLEVNVNETAQQLNLAVFGFSFASFPGVPSVAGPFGVFDARAKLSAPLWDQRLRYGLQASDQRSKAAALSGEDAKDTVAMVVA